MSKITQRGSGTLAAILAVAVVAVIGLGGWYISSRNRAAVTMVPEPQTSDSGSKKSSPPAAASGDLDTSATVTMDDATIQKTTFSKVQKGLQNRIILSTKSLAPDCVKNNAIVDSNGNPADQDVSYMPEGYALTNLGCSDGLSAGLFAAHQGSWVEVGHTQFQYKCADLKKYHVPASLIQTDPTVPVQCIGDDPNATTGETYQG